jgi:competence ComEA-like helix-hairpin-helix protein
LKKESTIPKTSSFLTALLLLILALCPFLYHFLQNSGTGPKSQNTSYWLALLNSPPFTPSLAASSQLPEKLPGASQLVLGQKIDLNRASEKDLEVLPGIGPKMAATIIQDRKERGPFLKLEDLRRVKGFKEKKFLQIKAFITLQEGESPKS